MVCDTKKEARRVAYFGAVKMASAAYRYEETMAFDLDGQTLRRGAYWVVSPAGQGYLVSDNPFSESRELTCNCPFAKENWGICKHSLKIGWLLSEREEQAEQDAQEDRIANEAEARMGAECPTHGCVPRPHHAGIA